MEDDFKDYARSLTVFFMGIGFLLAFVGFYFTEVIFYIAIGWECATVLIMILMQESVHEWFVLKKKLRLARKENKKLDGSRHRVVGEETSVIENSKPQKSNTTENKSIL